MKTRFPIKEGMMEFFEDHIEIKDKWKSARITSYVLPFSSILYPLALVLRSEHDGLWQFGLGLLIVSGFLLLYRIINPKKRIYQGQLQIDQIELVVLERYNYDKLSAKFILKGGKRRLVDLDFDRYWKADLEQALEAKGIITESV